MPSMDTRGVMNMKPEAEAQHKGASCAFEEGKSKLMLGFKGINTKCLYENELMCLKTNEACCDGVSWTRYSDQDSYRI